jgi:catechol 2,3-dioxygenase-like lactoylglutathione lyase family enzyme
MFKIGKVFHLTHVIEDLEAVDRWYDEIFSCQRFYHGYEKAAVREASLLVIADIVMEPVQLAKVPGAEQSPIGKFRARFGEHFHSIAWYVDDTAACIASLDARGIRQVGLTGKPITEPRRGIATWTHPKDTHALFEFAEANYTNDPRLEPGWSAAFWRDEHPLGIERTSHITVLFKDLQDARDVYQGSLSGRPLHETEAPGVSRSVFFAIGEDTVIEATQPLRSDTPEGQDLERNGEGIFGLTFRSRNLQKAADFLTSQQQPIDTSQPNVLRLDPKHSFGMPIAFTDVDIPNDTR